MNIEQLSKKLKALALLDAIIEHEWQDRYFSYNATWSDTEEMGSMRDGSGGEWFVWFSGDLAGFKCLLPEAGLMKNLAEVKATAGSAYSQFLTESAFSMEQATCIWLLNNTNWVKHGLPVDELFDLEYIYKLTAQDYQTWAQEYYEREVDLGAIEKILNGQYSEEITRTLNPNIEMSELLADLTEIGLKWN